MALTIQDVEKLQNKHPDLRFELWDGEIIVMSPSDYASDEIGTSFATLLSHWVRPRKLGRITGSSAGFRMPNGDLVAPDAAFVIAEKLRESPRSYADLVPDLVVEVKSSSDSVKRQKAKVERFIERGSLYGVLIDPGKHTVTIYRRGADPVVLLDGDTLAVPDLLPGWEISVSELWPLVF